METKAKEYTRKNSALIVIGLMLLVVIMSVFVFSRQSLRLDEAQSLWQTSHTPTQILNIIAQDVHVPFYHFILHFWQLFLGNSVFTGRALSLIFFLLSIPALYVFGTRIYSKNISLFATVLYTISPFMNWYGNEIRMYSLLTLLTVLSQYFFLRIYRVRDSDSWIGYFLVNLFGIFTHYFFFFVLIVQALFYILYSYLFPKKSFRKFIISAIVLILLFSPWIYYVRSLGTLTNEVPVLAAPTSVNIFNAFSQFLFGFQNDHLNTILVSLWPLTVLLGFLALRENKRVTPETIYLLMSILVPIAAAFAVSVVVQPLFVSRYLILTVPSLYLFIGWIFSTYPRPLERTLRAILVFAMTASLIVEIASPTSPVKEDYRAAATFLENNAGAPDIIILSAPFTVYPVEYYYRGEAEIETLPIWNRFAHGAIPPFVQSQLSDQVAALKGSHEKAYLLLSYDQGYEETIRLYFDHNFQRLGVKTFSPGLNLYVYKLRYDPSVFGT